MLLPRTRLGNFGRLLAILLPSAPVALLGLSGVQVVGDVGEIPRGLPLSSLPSLWGLSFDLVTGALAVAVVILVQGAGVSQSVPNPDGAQRSASRDFIAQGAANVVSGVFRRLPVGGSNSATALNVIYGARSRWAAILAGVCVALIVMLAPTLLAHITMPALGALLILAGASSLQPRDIRLVWQVGWPPRVAGIATFLATLLLSIQAAVGIGVALSALLYLNRSSTDISLLRLVERPDGQIEEREAPKHLPSDEVTVLDVYGNLFYAGARTLERLLPSPQDARSPVVTLRFRGYTRVGATLIEVMDEYADALAAVGGQLYLTGVEPKVGEQLWRAGKLGSCLAG